MNPLKINDPLDTLLREQNQYIEDNGFTARVVSALPLRRARFWTHQTFLLAVTVGGAVLAVRWLPWENLPAFNWSALLSLNSHLLVPWAVIVSVVGALVWAAVSAVQEED
ncbi:MAG: hypothetical protein ABSF51_05685 [Verrucomicrobiota bacterium]|jgi:hypothetical protein